MAKVFSFGKGSIVQQVQVVQDWGEKAMSGRPTNSIPSQNSIREQYK